MPLIRRRRACWADRIPIIGQWPRRPMCDCLQYLLNLDSFPPYDVLGHICTWRRSGSSRLIVSEALRLHRYQSASYLPPSRTSFQVPTGARFRNRLLSFAIKDQAGVSQNGCCWNMSMSSISTQNGSGPNTPASSDSTVVASPSSWKTLAPFDDPGQAKRQPYLDVPSFRPSLDSTYSELSELSFHSSELHNRHPLIRSLSRDADTSSQRRRPPSRFQASWDSFIETNYGALLVLASQGFGTGMNISARLLETPGPHGEPMHPFQILFARQSITAAICTAYGLYTKSIPAFLRCTWSSVASDSASRRWFLGSVRDVLQPAVSAVKRSYCPWLPEPDPCLLSLQFYHTRGNLLSTTTDRRLC